MRRARFLLILTGALVLGACARQRPATYVMDPATGQPVPVVAQQPYAAPYGQQQYAQGYTQSRQAQAAEPPAPPPRGLFGTRSSAAAYPPPQAYAPQYYSPQPAYAPQPQSHPQQSYVLQYTPPQPQPYAAPRPAAMPAQSYAAPYGYAYAYAPTEQPYTLDAGDRLRIVVFGQEGISNSYLVDAGGNINLPLIGMVQARGYTTQQLTQEITERLKHGYIREPHVSVEVETYRPFFILGEVTNPGQYPYVANMTAETAIAIAGGFAPRASKSSVKLTRNTPMQKFTGEVPLATPLRPGDTIIVKERWF